MSGSELTNGLDRRLALTLGVAVAGGAVAALAHPAAAQPYGPDEGKETGTPGIRSVLVSERGSMHGRDSVLPGYKRIRVVDVVFQAGKKNTDDGMQNDMVCQCIEGELRLDHRDGHAFSAKKGDVWTCVKGEPEDVENTGSTVAIMRVISLLPN